MNQKPESRYGGYSEPSKSSGPSLPFRCMLGIGVGFIVACLGPLLWRAIYAGNSSGTLPNIVSFLSPFIIGSAIAAAIRFIARSSDRFVSIVATVLTIVSCFTGYIWTDLTLVPWVVPPTSIVDGFNHLFNDVQALLLIVIAAFVAWMIARVGNASPPERQSS